MLSLIGRCRCPLPTGFSNRFQTRPFGTASLCRVDTTGEAESERAPAVQNVLLGVDPDTHGAIACCTWAAVSDPEAVVDLSSISLKVFDMPCATVQLVKKMKATGKPAVRRYEAVIGAG